MAVLAPFFFFSPPSTPFYFYIHSWSDSTISYIFLWPVQSSNPSARHHLSSFIKEKSFKKKVSMKNVPSNGPKSGRLTGSAHLLLLSRPKPLLTVCGMASVTSWRLLSSTRNSSARKKAAGELQVWTRGTGGPRSLKEIKVNEIHVVRRGNTTKKFRIIRLLCCGHPISFVQPRLLSRERHLPANYLFSSAQKSQSSSTMSHSIYYIFSEEFSLLYYKTDSNKFEKKRKKEIKNFSLPLV